MPVWTIAGEAGKAWDATQQTMAYRQIEGANLTFRSLASDELVLDIEAEDIASYTAPELGQIVRLYRSGALFFTGHVTSNPVTFSAQSQSLRIVVSGAWWWMERINYTSTQTDGAGGTATRMTGIFGDVTSGSNLKTAIETAIDRCVVLGVPIANIAGGSSVATFFTIPRITLNQSTCAQVISELVRLVPDTMVYFDYSTTTPTIQVTRRGVAMTRTLTLGTDPVESIDVQPVYEMKVDRVELPFVERNREGRTVYNTQASGTATNGRVQIITVSGPELDTFLPNDLFDFNIASFFVNYEQIALFTPSFRSGVNAGLKLGDYNLDGGFYGGRSSASSFSGSTGYTVAAPTFTDGNGNAASFTGKTLTLADNVPEWFMQAYDAQKVTATGFIATSLLVSTTPPKWLTEMGLQPTWYPYWVDIDTSSGENWVGRQLYTAKFQFDFLAIATAPHYTGNVVARTTTTITLASTASNIDGFYVGAFITARGNFPGRTVTAYNASTKTVTFAAVTNSQLAPTTQPYELTNIKIYKPADYSFVFPPANLASNLVAAQNYVPYEGGITVVNEVAGGTRYRGTKINIIGSLSEHSTMGALVAEESINIATGQTTITLGTPPRLDYRTFVDRIRKTAQDNIVYL